MTLYSLLHRKVTFHFSLLQCMCQVSRQTLDLSAGRFLFNQANRVQKHERQDKVQNKQRSKSFGEQEKEG